MKFVHIGRFRGFSMVYTIIVLTVMFAVASLAVDYARVQLGKSELQTAADAAGRAACVALANGVAAAETAATQTAAANKCDGVSIAIDPSKDLVFGDWDSDARTFTAKSGPARADANAVRVSIARSKKNKNPIDLMYASLAGVSTFDVGANTTICVLGGSRYSIIGLNGITLRDAAFTDSYDSSVGVYNAATASSRGSIASNGDILLRDTVKVKGDARCGVGKTTTLQNSASVSGRKLKLPGALAFASAVAPAGAINLANVSYTSGTYTLAGGTYVIDNLTLGGTAVINYTGPSVIYVRSSYSVSGNVVINTYQNKPANRKLYFLPTCSSATWTGSHKCVGELYAPDTSFTVSGTAGLFGRITAKSITVSQNAAMHYDEALAPIGTIGSGTEDYARVE